MIEHRFDHIAESADRRKAWIESTAAFVETQVDPDAFFPPSVYHRHFNLKGLVFAECSTSPQKVQRTFSLIASQNIDHLSVVLHRRGKTQVSFGNEEADLMPDTIVVSDISRPLTSVTGGGYGVGITVPQRVLEACGVNAYSLHGRIVPASSSPMMMLLADHMRNLAACLGTATPPQKDRLATATLAMCNAAFLPQTDSAYDHAAVGRIAMRHFIDRNLATVDAEALMAQFGLSRTPLYKLFEAEGGVYAYIRGRRLAHAMQQLTRPSGERRPTIKQLTFACGFENEQVFSRAFRRKYGLNPSAVDITHRPYADWDRTSRLMAWLKDL